jgi:hypothetical protein
MPSLKRAVPQDQRVFRRHKEELLNGVTLEFYHNLPDDPHLNVDSTLVNWMFKTEVFTVESLAEYARSKDAEYRVLTKEQYKDMRTGSR